MAEERFELIEHTADIGLMAYGEDLAGAFVNAAYGMSSIMAELEDVKEAEFRLVEVEEDDWEGLLFEWLNQLVYLFDVARLIFTRFEVLEFEEYHLKVNCYGEKYDPARHRLQAAVKSATYHQLEVDTARNRVQVIFDI
jgi:SHS2 domain-containing protein